MVPAETVLRTVPPETEPVNSTGLSGRTFLGQKRLSGNGGGVAVGAGVGWGVGVAEACGVAEGFAVDFLSGVVSFPLLTHMLMPPTTIRKRMICPRHPMHPEALPSGAGGWPDVSV